MQPIDREGVKSIMGTFFIATLVAAIGTGVFTAEYANWVFGIGAALIVLGGLPILAFFAFIYGLIKASL